MINYTGERMVPWDLRCGPNLMHHHIMRYTWATPRVYAKEVVDLGCGAGYGSFLLSWVARCVLGIDQDQDTIAFARERFRANNLMFEAGDIAAAVYPAQVYVAFEVLEHLRYPDKILKRYSPLLWSIPVDSPGPFHARSYSVHSIDQLMGVGGWFQGDDGTIVQRERAWFKPKYVLGIWEGKK